MFKKIVFLKIMLIVLLCKTGQAQITHDHTADSIRNANALKCGLTQDYLSSRGIPDFPATGGATALLVPPDSFPSSAIKTCGSFTIYYEDLRLGLSHGFDEGAIGVQRQNTLCAVLNYLESVFDFSGVSPGAINLYVDASDYSGGPASTIGFGRGMPFYSSRATLPPCEIRNGYVHQFITTGLDPFFGLPADYHGELKMNFQKDYQNDHTVTTPVSCQYDLYSVLLHQMSHVLGWFSFLDVDPSSGAVFNTKSPTSPYLFTNLDNAINYTSRTYYKGSAIIPNPFGSIVPLVSSCGIAAPTFPMHFWTNGLQPPYNHAIGADDLNHLQDKDYSYEYYSRVSPGDFQPYVMSAVTNKGIYKRTFTKGELETFKYGIGYTYTSAFTTANSAVLNNHTPYSMKMKSDTYSNLVDYDWGSMELIAPDYTVVNDAGNTVVIDLNSVTSKLDLKDDDGDFLSVLEGSLHNIRGCGEGGNNHNSITLNATKDIITYTPRDDFYGKAQFGFNLWDGTEKGAYVIYTIDVQRGNKVAIPYGDNLVLNGDFEEGSEVKLLGVNELINNSRSIEYLQGRWQHGQHLSDCQPFGAYQSYNWGTSIRSSAAACAATTNHKDFGAGFNTIPFLDPAGYSFPLPLSSIGNRYVPISQEGQLFYLGGNMQDCHRYVLEFDAIRTHLTATYPDEEIEFGFTDDAHVVKPPSGSLSTTTLLYKLTPKATTVLNTASWKHIKIVFNYCSAASANVLYLSLKGILGTTPGSQAIDNLSIREVNDLTVTASVESAGSCLRKLIANSDETASYGCSSVLFTWTEVGKGVIGTGKEIFVEPLVPTTYIVTADDGCGRTATDEITVTPCRCSPYFVMGTSSFTVLNSLAPIPSPLAPGNYFLTSDISLPADNNFTGVNMLIDPGITISVDPNVKLTIDNSHLFVCPDTNKLWKGIDLSSNPSASARIEVRNNSLIEDAEIAIRAIKPVTPGSGNIIETNEAVFNRNNNGIWIEDYTPSSPLTYPFAFKSTVMTSRDFRPHTGYAGYAGYPGVWPAATPLKTTLPNAVATAPYELCSTYAPVYCKDNTPAYKGMHLIKTGNTSGSIFAEIVVGTSSDSFQRNLFDHLGDGIVAANTNLTAYNNVFANMFILSPLTSFLPSSGSGINAYGKNNRLQVLGNYTVFNYPVENRFYDCNIGINAAVWSLNSTLSIFQTSNTVPYSTPPRLSPGLPAGIRSSISQYILRKADQNKFYNVPHGIVMVSSAYNGFYFGQTTISENTIQSQPPGIPAFNPAYYVYQGIVVDNVTWIGKPGTLAGNNAVTGNTLTDVYNGIAMQGNNRINSALSNNTVELRNWPPHVQYGMSFTGAVAGIDKDVAGSIGNLNTAASANTVTGLGSAFNNDKVRGYYASFNTNLKLCSNYAYNLGRGFEYAQTTPQVGTRWISNTMNNNLKGMVLGSDIGDQGFTNDHSTMRSFYGATLNQWTGSTWTGSKYHTFGENKRDTRNSKLWVRSGSYALLENPVNNLSIPPLPAYLMYHSASLPVASRTSNCEGAIYPIKGSPGPWFAKPLALVVLADSLGDDTVFRRNQWMAQLSLYEMTVLDSTLRDSSDVLDSFMVAAAGSRFQWLTAIETALADSDIATAQTLLASPVAAMGRVVISPDLVITDYTSANGVVDNYVDLYEVYLKHLQNNLGTNDSGMLETLANKCPAKDGAVVYKARSLYNLLFGHHIVYEDDSCKYDPSGNFYRVTPGIAEEGNGKQQYSLYPNPNEGSFVIARNEVYLPSKGNKMVQAKVYDILGRQVLQTQLNFVNGKAALKLPQVLPGQYMIYIADEGTNTRIKFTVK